MKRFLDIESPIGLLRLVSGEAGLTELDLRPPPKRQLPQDEWRESPGLRPLSMAAEQLTQYFAGDRRVFDLPLAPAGTPFQQRVWAALQEIPYGTTWSYGQLAAHIGSAGAARAVGLANNRNPIAIIIPCHRVIGADGSLVGYGGGLPMKEWLLRHEDARVGSQGSLFG
jgi:methylated-DNA-[protein]-cysteine S-methyltransferase